MECAICYEKFITPKTREAIKDLCNEYIIGKEIDEINKFTNLLITTKHNETHSCPTPNCECLICRDCWIKITHKGKDIYTANTDDMPRIFDKFICPYCRIVDWKYYMNNVFNELQQKVLGMDEWGRMFDERVLSLIMGL